mgnify:CR=1 FL=1
MENSEQTNQRQNVIKSMMTSGLIVGILLALTFICSTQSSTYIKIIMYAIEVATLVLVWFYAKKYRDTELGGYISWGQAFGYIVGIYFFGALIGAITRLVYLQWIDTAYLENMFEQVMTIVEDSSTNLPDDFADLLQKLLTPINIALYSIMGECMGGVFVGAIMGIFLRKKETI